MCIRDSYKDGHYELRGEGITLDSAGLVDRWESWVDKYPICLLYTSRCV